MNKKKIMSLVAACILTVQFVTSNISIANAQDTNGYSCDPVASAEYQAKTEQSVSSNYDTISVTDGYVINAVYVKAGAENIGYGKGCTAPYTTDGDDGNYIVSGIGTNTVIVTKPEGSEAKDISHLEVIFAEAIVVVDDDYSDDDDNAGEETQDDPSENANEEEINEDTNDEENVAGEAITEEESVTKSENTEEVLGSATKIESEKKGEVLGTTEMASTGVNLAIFAQMGQAISIMILAGNALKNKRK